MHRFCDRYDRHTTHRSFFQVDYQAFIPDLSVGDCEQSVILRLLEEDLLDDNLNWIKVLIARSLELIESSFITEQCLISHKRLLDFMQNVICYTKIEKIYLAYLEYPLKIGISLGENTLISPLLRLSCLVKDFHAIFEFEPKQGIEEDFQNTKDLVYGISDFIKKGLKPLSISNSFFKANYFNERRIVLEILSLCGRIETLQANRKGVSQKTTPKDRKAADIPSEVDEVEWQMRGEVSKLDYNAQMIKSLTLDAYNHNAVNYHRLEPETQVISNAENLEPLLRKRGNYFDGIMADVEYHCAEDCARKYFNINKYDREIKDKTQTSRQELPGTLTTIFTRRDSVQSIQDHDTSIMHYADLVSSEAELSKRDRFPMTTSIVLDQPDQDFSKKIELLSLVDVDYDPEAGWTISTNPEQQRKLKQIEIELVEQSKCYTQNTVRSTDYTHRKESSTRVTLEDSDEEIDTTERKRLLRNRISNVIFETNEESSSPGLTSISIDPIAFNKRISREHKVISSNKSLESHRKRAFSSAQSNISFLNHEFSYQILGHCTIEEENYVVTDRSNENQVAEKDLSENDGELKKLSQLIRNDEKKFISMASSYEKLFEKAGLSLGARKARIDYLWQVARDFVNLQIFFKKKLGENICLKA